MQEATEGQPGSQRTGKGRQRPFLATVAVLGVSLLALFAIVASPMSTAVAAAVPPAAAHIASSPHVDAGPGGGYWLGASDGGIFSFGSATFNGSTGGIPLNKPIVGLAATPDGGGYWEVASDGGIFAFGDANFFGSTGALALNKPIVGMASTRDGNGYWLVASDGGIFSFGDAGFHGSTGAIHLAAPIVGLTATPDGQGYWLVASDGGIFSFGDAVFFGSTGGIPLNKPIVGMAVAPSTGKKISPSNIVGVSCPTTCCAKRSMAPAMSSPTPTAPGRHRRSWILDRLPTTILARVSSTGSPARRQLGAWLSAIWMATPL